MKTITVFSDSHGMPLPNKLLSVANESDLVFFLGDGLLSLGDMPLHKGFHAVQGNCDSYCGFDDEQVIEVENVRILLTHGDKYRVKSDLTALSMRALELGCTLVLYGHTHFAAIDEYAGVTLVNPGSIYSARGSSPSYAYVVVTNTKFVAKIVNLTQIS